MACIGTVGEQWERYMLLVEAIMCIGAAIYFWIKPSKFLEDLVDPATPLITASSNPAAVIVTQLFQGRQFLLGVFSLFAFLYRDPYVILLGGCMFAAWCWFFCVSLLAYFARHNLHIPRSTIYTLAAVCLFFMLHVTGILMLAECI